MAEWDTPPTTFTLAEAIAELKRIGPVYSAATRLADQPFEHTRIDKLLAAVKTARPTRGPSKIATLGGDWPPTNNVMMDERTAADWAAIVSA